MTTTDQMLDGLDEARHALRCHDARAHIREAIESQTVLLEVEEIALVHVDDFSRTDRVNLTAYDSDGKRIGGDTVYDDDQSGMPLVPEMSAYYTGVEIPAGSDLSEVGEDGWVLNMSALRCYDLDADRLRTQRTMVVAHLQDLVCQGQARGFILDQDLMNPEAAMTASNERDRP